ncbi:MAG: hypothetical protein ABFS35_10555 [Bacteroidota bacterium]
MKILEKLFGNVKSRKISLIFIATGILLMIVALIFGISDNPPGIILAFISICAITLAFVHHWTKLKKFLVLLIGSVLGFPVFAVLHNLFYGLAIMAKDIIVVKQILEILDVSSFLIAIFLCPVGIIVGAIGSIVLAIKNKKVSRV